MEGNTGGKVQPLLPYHQHLLLMHPFADATAEDWAPLPSELCDSVEALQILRPEVGNLTPKETLGSCIPFVHCGAALPFPCSRDAVRSSKQQAPHIFQGNRQFPEVCPSSFTEFIVQAMAQVTALASTAAFIDSVGLLPVSKDLGSR